MRRLRIGTLAIALASGSAFLGARAAAPDAELAQAVLEVGKTSLAKKEWAQAQAQFKRALEEDPLLMEARVGLAEAHAGAGERPRASREMRAVLEALEGLPSLTPEQVALYSRARKRACELNREDATLDALVRKHADALTALSGKWGSKDAAASSEAARAALRLAPDHAKAADLRQRLGGGSDGKMVALFNGRDGTGWTKMSREWTVEQGLLVGNVPDRALLLPSQKRWSGNFDVLIEASLQEEFPKNGPPHFAVMGDWLDPDRNVALGYLRGDVMWRTQTGPSDAEEKDHFDRPYRDVDPKLDPKGWVLYEIRFRGNEMTALVGGKESVAHRGPRSASRATSR